MSLCLNAKPRSVARRFSRLPTRSSPPFRRCWSAGHASQFLPRVAARVASPVASRHTAQGSGEAADELSSVRGED